MCIWFFKQGGDSDADSDEEEDDSDEEETPKKVITRRFPRCFSGMDLTIFQVLSLIYTISLFSFSFFCRLK